MLAGTCTGCGQSLAITVGLDAHPLKLKAQRTAIGAACSQFSLLSLDLFPRLRQGISLLAFICTRLLFFVGQGQRMSGLQRINVGLIQGRREAVAA